MNIRTNECRIQYEKSKHRCSWPNLPFPLSVVHPCRRPLRGWQPLLLHRLEPADLCHPSHPPLHPVVGAARSGLCLLHEEAQVGRSRGEPCHEWRPLCMPQSLWPGIFLLHASIGGIQSIWSSKIESHWIVKNYSVVSTHMLQQLILEGRVSNWLLDSLKLK